MFLFGSAQKLSQTFQILSQTDDINIFNLKRKKNYKNKKKKKTPAAEI